MRIMLDSNVLISAALFRSPSINELMEFIFDNHTLVLASSVIDEVKGVVGYKFLHRQSDIDAYFEAINYELVVTDGIDDSYIIIRDNDDRKVIASALKAEVDVLITGDSDFFERDYAGIQILTPRKFLNKFANKELNS